MVCRDKNLCLRVKSTRQIMQEQTSPQPQLTKALTYVVLCTICSFFPSIIIADLCFSTFIEAYSLLILVVFLLDAIVLFGLTVARLKYKVIGVCVGYIVASLSFIGSMVAADKTDMYLHRIYQITVFTTCAVLGALCGYLSFRWLVGILQKKALTRKGESRP